MKKTFSFLSISIVYFTTVLPAFAAPEKIKKSGCVEKDIEGVKGAVVTLDCIPVLFQTVIYWALVFAGIVALFFIIFAGIKLLTSGGDQKRVEGGKKTLIWAITGLIIILLSFFILGFISDASGLPCIKSFGFGQCN